VVAEQTELAGTEVDWAVVVVEAPQKTAVQM